MLIVINKEQLIEVLKEQVTSWGNIAGGPLYDAFEFDPKKISPQELKALGYFENRDAWTAGVQIKKLKKYLEQIHATEQIRIA